MFNEQYSMLNVQQCDDKILNIENFVDDKKSIPLSQDALTFHYS